MAKKWGSKEAVVAAAPKKTAPKKIAVAKKEVHAKPLTEAKLDAKPAKKVSQNLIETIKKRQEEAAKKDGAPQGGGPGAKQRGMFGGRPGMRRGRRPKRPVEYTPVNSEEESFEEQSDYDGIEYETGVNLKGGRDEGSFSLDRVDDFDEELNFDR